MSPCSAHTHTHTDTNRDSRKSWCRLIPMMLLDFVICNVLLKSLKLCNDDLREFCKQCVIESK